MKKISKYLFLIIISFYYLWYRLGNPHKIKTKNKRQIPTLFIHGYLGNRMSFGWMLYRFEKYGWGQKSAVMRITKKQQLKIIGDPSIKDGFIQVIFSDNTHNITTQAKWLWQIMATLKIRYGVKEVNIVAHSMGAVSVLEYLSLYAGMNNVAKINKVVSLGAPYNDYETGKTSKQIENIPLTKTGPKVMTPLYQKFKKQSRYFSDKLFFLNIIGDLENGSHSDGVVSVNSVSSLRFLLNPENYEELIVYGKKATHKLLHENRQIDRRIGQFLFTR